MRISEASHNWHLFTTGSVSEVISHKENAARLSSAPQSINETLQPIYYMAIKLNCGSQSLLNLFKKLENAADTSTSIVHIPECHLISSATTCVPGKCFGTCVSNLSADGAII